MIEIEKQLTTLNMAEAIARRICRVVPEPQPNFNTKFDIAMQRIHAMSNEHQSDCPQRQ
jgi:hypothetical protein